MAQDFYRRAQILHEEFQKRELHYLNAEKKWNNMIWKKDIDIPPLQEYLQKLDKREMETEETYKSLMKQMEELDKHTDLMSLKLERLRILQSNITNMETSNWLHSLTDSNSLSLEANRLYAGTNINFSAQKQLKSASTQTENKIYCEKCSSEILVFHQPRYSIETIVPPVVSKFQSSFNVPPEATHLSNFPDPVALSNETQNVSSPIAPECSFVPSSDKSFTIGSKYQQQTDTELLKNSNTITEKHSSVIEHNLIHNSALLKHHVASGTLTETGNTLNETNSLHNSGLSKHEINSEDLRDHHVSAENNLLENTLPATNPHTVENVSSDLSKSKEVIEVDSAESKSLPNYETEKQTLLDNDASVSKSEGSINHEFDFLESDAANFSKDPKSEVGLKMVGSSSKDTSTRFDQTHSSVASKSKEQGEIASENHKLDDIEDKNDTSGSATGPQTPSIHSGNPSLASDSDSIGEKETPLKASAAYQALLGNTMIIETRKKQYSDSESEDEIENVLSNTVKKNNQIHPRPNQDVKNVPPKKDEKLDAPQVELKPNKPSKPSLANKPQSKLSKSTRKVLGLDTSSGSEVEIAPKPPGKKSEEDSDEFDFFD